ncbi:MAG: lamin tail domain-containing protein [Bacteroidales bacterium]
MSRALKNPVFMAVLGVFLSLMSARAQFTDGFDDGDFSQNPTWNGTNSLFKINSSKQLQLNGSGEGAAWLTTSSALVVPAEWRFWVKLSFAPSSNNFARVYLASDQPDLSGPLNGYFLQMGEAGSNDALELFRQNGTQTVSICRGTDGLLASSFTLRVKIIHKNDGTWEIWADPSGGSNFQLQATGTDLQLNSSQYFGVYCKYTSSNATKMYFDDFYAGEIQVDLTPPDLLSLEVTSDTSLALQFSEALAPQPAGSVLNYRLEPGSLYPSRVVFSSQTAGEVNLVFPTTFQPSLTYTLTIDSVKDLAGNKAGPWVRNFSLYQAQPFDIVINELMVDPDPPVGLPNWEYIELFNTTEWPVKLKNWKLVTGSTSKTIPDSEIPGGGFLILCRPEAIPELSAYGNCAAITSLSLANTGQDVKILDNYNRLISRVVYKDKWYRDPAKVNGGWSLEQIDPMAVCLGAANWKASENISGGTPGGPNSVLATLNNLPLPEALIVIDHSTLKLIFNQNMDSLSLVNPQLYKVSPSIGFADSAWIAGDDFTTVMLHFGAEFQQGVSYRLVLQEGLKNCRGVEVPAHTFRDFNVPAPTSRFDVLITEIMADPSPVVGLPEFEYVELYNQTSGTIDLSGWALQIGTTTRVFQQAYLEPQSYLIVGPDAAAGALGAYGAFYGFSSFQLTNAGQSVALINPIGQVISWVDYTDAWYGSSPKKEGGWSLEMVDYSNACTQQGNWKPSVDAMGGTPGRDNSVRAANPDLVPPKLLRAYPADDIHVSVYFSEPMNETSVVELLNWSLPNGPGTLISITPIDYRNQVFILTLSSPMEVGKTYLLRPQGEMYDCAGNLLADSEDVAFGLPGVPGPGEVIINEILTNPRTGGADYLELLNVSDKLLDLSAFSLTYLSLSDTSKPKTIFLPAWLMVPGQYYCLTRLPDAVASQYSVPAPAHLIETSQMPDFASDPGGKVIIALRENELSIIDRLEYRKAMHLPVLKNLDGVALERINPQRPTSDPTNWTSAAESAGFGTPTGKNSQYTEVPSPSGKVTVAPPIFSPDGDGIEDLVTLVLVAPGEGWLANVSIYDAMGRQVRKLARALSVGTQTSLSWDGTRDDRTLAPLGRYLIICEYYDTNGQREVVKTSVVLATRF